MEWAYVARDSLHLEFGVMNPRKISGCCQAMTTKGWQVIGPYSVHLGEEGHYRRRSAVCCQTDGSEHGREASMIPGQGREQLNRLEITGLPRKSSLAGVMQVWCGGWDDAGQRRTHTIKGILST